MKQHVFIRRDNEQVPGDWRRTLWHSLTSVKRWATRCGHVYEMRGDTLIVSTCDGTIHHYRAAALSDTSEEGKGVIAQ